MTRRHERLSSIIQREIATVIMREMSDPRIGPIYPSVNSVKLSDDISTADVYVSIMGTPGQRTAALAALQSASGMMRSHLAKAMEIRQVPAVRFHIDQGAIKEVEMIELLKKIEDERLEAEARAMAQTSNSADNSADSTTASNTQDPKE